MGLSIEPKAPEELAEATIAEVLKRLNTQGAHLLKLQLDLCNQAARGGGNDPAFWYDLDEAAGRMGFKRIASRRGYDHKTRRELHARLLTLSHLNVTIGRVGEGKRARHLVAPLWIIELRDIRESDIPLEADGSTPDPATLPHLPTPRAVMVRPGGWWGAMNTAQFLDIPAEVLKLPIDGKGNEVNRMAVQAAAILAVWERAGARKGAKPKTLGAILEAARITTLEDLKVNKHADRLRDNFLQALDVVRQKGGFDLEYIDDAEVSGRGWHSRFWAARVQITPRRIEGLNASRSEALEG
ncbi:hypothetical protein RDMS_00005 [Deinococcus sp. RL]|nr:hypothetical protein RDMS_00005 [Deinococcus sp. RL]